jgi:hypothetical protein
MANMSCSNNNEYYKNNGGLIKILQKIVVIAILESKQKSKSKDYSRDIENFRKTKERLFQKYGLNYAEYSGKMNYDILTTLLGNSDKREGLDMNKYLGIIKEIDEARKKIKIEDALSICPECDLKSGILKKISSDGPYYKCEACKNEYIQKPHQRPIIIENYKGNVRI